MPLRSRFAVMVLVALTGCSNPAPPATTAPAQAQPEEPAGPPLFEDITTTSGIAFAYRNGEDTAEHFSILESLGGGVALIDYDGDGRLDVYLPGGGGYAGPDKKRIVGFPGRLYRNLGGGKFEDATAAAGLDALAGGTPWFYSHGVAVADYDRDGWPDLLVTGWGRVALFHNVPAGPGKGRKFEDVTAAAGLGTGITWATSAAFADLDGDGFPDLYVYQYVDWSWAKNPRCGYNSTQQDVCPPKEFDGLPHKLFHNTGKGGFRDVSTEAGIRPGASHASKGLGVVVVDLDGDGKPDVYVANDTTDNFLYVNRSERGRIRLEEQGATSGAAVDERGMANGSMGVDAGDYEGSGRPGLWVTNYENEPHALYRNDSKPGRAFFLHRSTPAGVAAIGQKYVGWGTGFFDADLDGWEDVFVSNGHAIRYPTGKESARNQQPVLLLNQGGKFRNASRRLGAYGEKPRLGRGVGLGDLDNDGRTDLVISHTNQPAAVLRGIGGETHHWVGLQLEGKDHACVVGAKVTWEAGGRTQTRFAKGGGSYASSGDRRMVFGLGTETAGVLTVAWPGGGEERFEGLAVDRYYRVTQGGGKPEPLPGGAK